MAKKITPRRRADTVTVLPTPQDITALLLISLFNEPDRKRARKLYDAVASLTDDRHGLPDRVIHNDLTE